SARAPRGTLRRTGYDSFVPGQQLGSSVSPRLSRFESVPTRGWVLFVLDCFG
ncbi:uncharacterized protein PgNI_04746, partial [Pyricularia grisea]|uniref:Uncharacterized protein n=1 Tax=Pyricularia grisea TaxID=148305 RepID=A0A6P8B9C1_PYRGI